VNAAEIQARVEDQLQYAPDLLAYRRDIRRVITSVYAELCAQKAWPWLYRQEKILALPDLTIPNANLTRVGPRTFGISAASVWETAGMHSSLDTAAFEIYWPQLLGAELDLSDISNREQGTGNWPLAPFAIEHIITDSVGFPLIVLDPRCNITALHANLGTYKVSFRRLRMPARCDQILAITDNENRTIEALPPHLFRAMQEDPDRAGSGPCFFLPDGGFTPRLPAHTPGPYQLQISSATGVAGAEEARHDRNLPVYEDPPFTLAASNGAGLLTGVTYRVFVCWVYAGRYGPASKIVSATPSGANLRLTLSSLPQAASAAGTDGLGDTGRRLAVFMSEGDHGPFVEMGTTAAGNDTSLIIATRPTAQLVSNPPKLRRWDAVYPQGPYTYIRLWPRSDESRILTLTYLAKPLQLIHDVDEPELPEAFHRVLVHGVVVDMIQRFGAGTNILRMQQEILRQGMQALYNRYLPEMRYHRQKGLLGGGVPTGIRHPTSITVGE
jgi:hypothetical protein